MVSAEDYWPFITLCGPKSIAVTKGWMSSNKISIPDDELYRVRDILAQTAADKGSVTKGTLFKHWRKEACRWMTIDCHITSAWLSSLELSVAETYCR